MVDFLVLDFYFSHAQARGLRTTEIVWEFLLALLMGHVLNLHVFCTRDQDNVFALELLIIRRKLWPLLF